MNKKNRINMCVVQCTSACKVFVYKTKWENET